MDKIGVYAIINKINNKIYIGSTIKSFRERRNLHLHQLKNGIHHNKHLQRAWDKYGNENFKFKIIEIVMDSECVIEREQYYIDLFDSSNIEKGYNINPIAGSQLGFKWAEEQKEKLSDKFRGENNPFYGMKHSDEFKKRLSENRKGKNNPMYGKSNTKLNLNDLLEIKNMLLEETNEKIKDKDTRIASKFNVSIQTIRRIKEGKHVLSNQIGGKMKEWKDN